MKSPKKFFQRPLGNCGTFLRPLGFISLAWLAFSGCHHSPPEGGPAKGKVVRYGFPLEKMVTTYEYFTGRTDATESVEVRSRVTGYLTEINFEPGAEVKKNQVLFKIDPRPYQAVLDQANSQIALAEARFKLALADYERAKVLARGGGGVISGQDLDKYAASVNESSASVKAAKANALGAELNVTFTTITSPIDGVIGRPLITQGNLVTQDSTLLTTIVSEDPMFGYFDVDERTMLRIQKLIREGKLISVKQGKVEVEMGLANEGDLYPHKGSLDFVNNTVDPATGTLQVRGIFENPLPANGTRRILMPGLFVRIRFPVGQPHKSLLVTQAAIGTDQGKKFLLVVNEKNIVEYRPVELGPQQPGGMQVIEPVPIVHGEKGIRLAREGEASQPSLKATDRVIVRGLQRVRPGELVNPQPADKEEK